MKWMIVAEHLEKDAAEHRLFAQRPELDPQARIAAGICASILDDLSTALKAGCTLTLTRNPPDKTEA